MGIEEKIDTLWWGVVALIVLVLVIVYSMYVEGMLYLPGMEADRAAKGKKSGFMAYTIQGTNPFWDGIIDDYKTGGTYHNISMDF